MKGLVDLEELEFFETDVTLAGAETLKKELPNCHMELRRINFFHVIIQHNSDRSLKK